MKMRIKYTILEKLFYILPGLVLFLHIHIIECKNNGNKIIQVYRNQILLKGKPLQVVSGSAHYFRIPVKYWRDRFQMMRAAGLNAVSTYVEWSYHEPEERQYIFHNERNLTKYIQTAAEEGLYVLLRPGPYICAERDLGGLPYWLLGKYPNITLRTNDEDYMQETKIWMRKLFTHISHLLYGNGGPIILVQVENEYGSYGNDTMYMRRVRNMINEHVGSNALLYTSDAYSDVQYLQGTLPTINFGNHRDHKLKQAFRIFADRVQDEFPLMSSEFYTGWMTHWGDTHPSSISSNQLVEGLTQLFNINASVNFYVFCGGTNFEFTSGANKDDSFAPQITSYDYDAPLSEAGDPTPKYFAIRDVIQKHFPEVNHLPTPINLDKGAYGVVEVMPRMGLLTPEGRHRFGRKYGSFIGATLPTFEVLRQRAGLILYETTLNNSGGTIYIEKPRDRIYTYVDNNLIGIFDRSKNLKSMKIKAKPGSTLSLLVENQGRINYKYFNDTKGILSPVIYENKILNGKWVIIGFPLQSMNIFNDDAISEPDINNGPVVYSAGFVLPNNTDALDTYLDTTGWGKGCIWINGQNLGRYWPRAGPQVTLFVPGVWLNKAPIENSLGILELEKVPDDKAVKFIDHSIYHRFNQ